MKWDRKGQNRTVCTRAYARARAHTQVFLFAHTATKMLACRGSMSKKCPRVEDGKSFVEVSKTVSFTGVEQVEVKLDGTGDRKEDFSLRNFIVKESADSGAGVYKAQTFLRTGTLKISFGTCVYRQCFSSIELAGQGAPIERNSQLAGIY